MIKNEYVEVTAIGNSIRYLKELGFDFKYKDIILVNISNLPKNSNIKVDVCCDMCGKEKQITFQKYCKNTKNLTIEYACSRMCASNKIKNTNLEKYGFENPIKNAEVINKSKKTCLNRYGTENAFESDVVKEKIKQTNLEKYGTENVFESDEIKEKIKKTNLVKYGCESVLSCEEIRNKSKITIYEKYNVDYITQSSEIKDKIKKTNLEKYGSEYVSKLNFFKDKTKATNFERYGTEYPIQSILVKNKLSETKLRKNEKKFISKFQKIDDYDFVSYKFNNIELHHISCGRNFNINTKNILNRLNSKIPLCVQCYPISDQKSIKEKELVKWIGNNTKSVSSKNRTILEGKELDIYIPEYNLAIEFNGLYWHSEKYKDKNYHLDKSIRCLEKGIDLLHIWEDEWIFKQDIVKSIILNSIGLITNKLYA